MLAQSFSSLHKHLDSFSHSFFLAAPMMSKLALAFSFASASYGARVKKHDAEAGSSIAGVPMINDQADADDFIVMFADGTTEKDIAKFCNGQCRLFGNAWASVSGRTNVEQMLQLRAGVGIDFVEPDVMDDLDPIIEEDDEVSAQSLWGLPKVGNPTAPGRGRGVHVYIQDTGIRVSHNDFTGRASTSIDITSGSLVECRGDRNCADDENGHGTHCAGTAAGNGYGIATQALIYSVKTLGARGGARSWQYMAIDWVATKGSRPRVLSMSLGGRGADPGYDRVFGPAMEAGVVVVVAGGNSNSDACNFSPAFSSLVITVGSTTSTNSRSSFSNFGRCTNIMAPGSAILSAWRGSNSATRTISGTSMACPHVSGGAAVVLGLNPEWSVVQVRGSIMDSALEGAVSDLRGSADKFLWVGA